MHMHELIQLVENDLQRAQGREQIAVLQSLCRKLITDYSLVVAGATIEPLWVEAYYYDEERFPDRNTHLSGLQKNRFGQLYFHRKGYGGVDICLSASEDYYLSVLLKATRIDGGFYTQTGIGALLTETGRSRETLESARNVLQIRADALPYTIGFAKRVGLTKPCYAEEELAAFPMEALACDRYNFAFARKSLTPKVVETMKAYRSRTHCTKKECKEQCKAWFGWVPDAVGRLFGEEE